MKKMLLILPLLLAGCSYSGENLSENPLLSPTSASGISAGQSHDRSGATLMQSEPADVTTPKIIFEKNLSPDIRIIQNQHDATVFFRDQKIASKANTISSDLEYEMIGDDIMSILQTNQFHPANFSDEQKQQFGQLYAQKYFYLYDQNPYSDHKLVIADGISLLTHRVYEGPSIGWIIDESYGRVRKLEGEVFGIKQINRHEGGWLVLGQNSYGDSVREYLDWYQVDGKIYHLPIKKLSYTQEESHDRFEIIGKNQIKVWQSFPSSGGQNSYIITMGAS